MIFADANATFAQLGDFRSVALGDNAAAGSLGKTV
jgi:hypothetical protein